MKRRSILAILIAVSMMFIMATPIAADEKPVLIDNESEFDSDVIFDVTASMTEVEDNAVVYSINITWGDMHFEFSRGSRVWDPVTHKYSNNAAGWVYPADDDDKGLIRISNHSNIAIDATIDFAMNDDAFGAGDPVVGGLYNTWQEAKNSAMSLNSNGGYLTTTILNLYTAVGRPPDENDDNVGEIYLALSGTPDASVNFTNQTTIGTITVTLALSNDATRNVPREP